MTADNTQVGILKCKIDECLTTEEINNCFIQLSGYSIGDKYSYFQNYLIKFDYPEDFPVLYTLQSAISQRKTCTAANVMYNSKHAYSPGNT